MMSILKRSLGKCDATSVVPSRGEWIQYVNGGHFVLATNSEFMLRCFSVVFWSKIGRDIDNVNTDVVPALFYKR